MSSANRVPFCSGLNMLTHYCQVMHIWVSKLYLNNAGILLLEQLRSNFKEILKIENKFQTRKYIWKYCLQNDSHFGQTSMSWVAYTNSIIFEQIMKFDPQLCDVIVDGLMWRLLTVWAECEYTCWTHEAKYSSIFKWYVIENPYWQINSLRSNDAYMRW